MSDTFEDLKDISPGTNVNYHIEDGKPISRIVSEIDEIARTVTLLPKRVVQFDAPSTPEPTREVEAIVKDAVR